MEKASYLDIIHIHYGTPPKATEDMGIHLEISGQGCRFLKPIGKTSFLGLISSNFLSCMISKGNSCRSSA
ncbi:hypothetical protein GQR36_05230 [Enterococcus termitis]